MDAELKAKWTAALRSGELKQAKGRLKRGDALCCIGVLAQVQNCTWDDNDTPKTEQQWLAVSGNNVLYSKYAGGLDVEQQQKLAEMNDSGKSFAEIADYIDANY